MKRVLDRNNLEKPQLRLKKKVLLCSHFQSSFISLSFHISFNMHKTKNFVYVYIY